MTQLGQPLLPSGLLSLPGLWLGGVTYPQNQCQIRGPGGDPSPDLLSLRVKNTPTHAWLWVMSYKELQL